MTGSRIALAWWSFVAPVWAQAEAEPPALAPEVARELEALRALVGPPAGATELVLVPVPRFGSPQRPEEGLGWLVGEGEDARVVLLGGLTIAAPRKRARVDLIGEAVEFYAEGGSALSLDPSTTHGVPDCRPAVHAAWLHARGRDDLAARAWALSQAELAEQSVAYLQDELVVQTAGRIRDAFAVGDDAAAWAMLSWARAHQLRQPELSESIAAHLRPAAAEGRLGQTPPTRPAGWSRWDGAERLRWLLDVALPEVSIRNGSARELLDHPRVQAILAQGDAAVPALIGRVEADSRVTRWLTPQGGAWSLLRVQQAALILAWEIVGVRVRPERASVYPFPGLEDPALQAAMLRRFWRAHGHRSRVERLTAVAGELASGWGPAAAEGLTELGPRSLDGRLVLNPVLAQPEPIAARAVLRQYTADPGADAALLEHLVALGDARVAGEVAAAARALPPRHQRRLLLAEAAARLGDVGPLQEWFAWAAVEGSQLDLHRTLDVACRSGSFGLGFVSAVFDPDSERWPALRDHVLDQAYGMPRRLRWEGATARRPGWSQHPALMRLLLPLLNDETSTGRAWVVDPSGKYAVRQGKPGIQLDARRFGEGLRQEADERVCDQVSAWLSHRVWGVPLAHALRDDQAATLSWIRLAVQRCRVRALTPAERLALGATSQRFVLDPPTVEVPESVGPHWVPLPAVAELAQTAERVVVVQGELLPDGRAIWVVVGESAGPERVRGEELDGEPVPVAEAARRGRR